MFLQTVYRLFAFATIINQSIHQAFATSVTAVNVYGTIGIHDDSKISYYMGNFFYKGPSTFTLCASYCRKDVPKCKSFRYSYWADSAAQYCEFFDNGLEGNVTADSSQPYYYYDIGCLLPAYIDVSTSNDTPVAATKCTKIQYQSQISTTTYTLPATTRTVTQTTTKTPDTQIRTNYTTITTTVSSTTTQTTTQTTTRTQQLNQTITTTLTQFARTTIRETPPPTTTTVLRISTASSASTIIISRISTLVRFRSTTVSSTRSVTSVQTTTVTRQVAGTVVGARTVTVTVTRVVTTTRRG